MANIFVANAKTLYYSNIANVIQTVANVSILYAGNINIGNANLLSYIL